MFCKSQALILSFEILGVVRLNSSSLSLECEDFPNTIVQAITKEGFMGSRILTLDGNR